VLITIGANDVYTHILSANTGVSSGNAVDGAKMDSGVGIGVGVGMEVLDGSSGYNNLNPINVSQRQFLDRGPPPALSVPLPFSSHMNFAAEGVSVQGAIRPSPFTHDYFVNQSSQLPSTSFSTFPTFSRVPLSYIGGRGFPFIGGFFFFLMALF
jgi:hypothetical protein